MKDRFEKFSRVATCIAGGLIASLSFSGDAQAKFKGPGIYEINFSHDGQALDVDLSWGQGSARGQRVIRAKVNRGSNQKFVIFEDGDAYIIRPVHSLLCLHLAGDHPDVGLVQERCSRDVGQRFLIGTGNETVISTASGTNILNASNEGNPVVLVKAGPNPSKNRLFKFRKL